MNWTWSSRVKYMTCKCDHDLYTIAESCVLHNVSLIGPRPGQMFVGPDLDPNCLILKLRFV